MALLDVSDILMDIDIAGDSVAVTRFQRSVDTTGRTVDTPYAVQTYGNVQPASGQQLEQLPEEERVGAFLSVTVPIPLVPLSATNAPDQITWNNQQYRVIKSMPWDNYGQGFYTAICQLIDTALTIQT